MGEHLEVSRPLTDKLEADAALLAKAQVNVANQVDERDRAIPYGQGLGIVVVSEKCHPSGDLIGEREGVFGPLA